ncbi:GNAT family N-acetyltransferase [candidate division CSSED10-310 bacterium]|uniref:GNAT family N-acetyltransferase n=1 Tax=candidate division CSSED10-310 bacterium TaxID=2855610 RepID=A0ABV6YWS2_UNCC1
MTHRVKSPTLTMGELQLIPFTLHHAQQRASWEKYGAREPLLAHIDLNFQSFTEIESWFDHKSTENMFWWAIIHQERLVGEVVIRALNDREMTGRLGIHFSPEERSKGYGSLVLSKLLAWFFTDSEYQVLQLDVAALNTWAINLYEKVGFRYQYCFWSGHDPRGGIEPFTDQSFSHLKNYFRRHQGKSEVLFLEMSIDKQQYLKYHRHMSEQG